MEFKGYLRNLVYLRLDEVDAFFDKDEEAFRRMSFDFCVLLHKVIFEL